MGVEQAEDGSQATHGDTHAVHAFGCSCRGGRLVFHQRCDQAGDEAAEGLGSGCIRRNGRRFRFDNFWRRAADKAPAPCGLAFWSEQQWKRRLQRLSSFVERGGRRPLELEL
jgi:hypothetical protein